MSFHHVLAATLLTVIAICPAGAQIAPSQLIPFAEFIREVRHADAHEFLARPSSKVQDLAAFEEMRQYILTLYRGVHVRHSYVLESQTIDCIPINQQPSLRDRGAEIAPEPPSSGTNTPPGNSNCEDHTIPMRRITLEQLSHFRTLHEFFEKTPNGSERAPEPSK